MRKIREWLSWFLLAGGVCLVSKGGFVVYPLILPPANEPFLLADRLDATNQTGEAFQPPPDGFSVYFPEARPSGQESEVLAEASISSSRSMEGAFLARLEIPRLQAAIRVVEGASDGALRLGAGHLRGTPLPGMASNSVIAGHRDTYFRVLKSIQVGDEVRIERGARQFAYTVVETRVVDPDDLSVLAPAEGRILTLITCYPFQYFGSAPQRFIVRARAADTD